MTSFIELNPATGIVTVTADGPTSFIELNPATGIVTAVGASAGGFTPNYFVNTLIGLDTNDGKSLSTPWLTVAKVNASTFVPGDIIGFCGGQTWAEQLIVPSSGSVVARVIFTAYGVGRATLQPGLALTQGVVAVNQSYFTLDNINFSGIGSSGDSYYAVDISSSSGQFTDVTVQNFSLTGFSADGLYVYGSVGGVSAGYNNVLISNFVISGCGGEGLGVWSSDAAGVMVHSNVTYQNGVVSGNGYSGCYISATTTGLITNVVGFSNGALLVQSAGPVGIWTYESDSVTISLCESYNNVSGNAIDGDGFDIDGGCTNCIIEYCYSHGNQGSGYQMFNYAGASEWNNNTIRNCISENDGTTGNFYSGLSMGTSGTTLTNANVYNNTFYSSLATLGSGHQIICLQGAGMTGIVANNIFYSASDTPIINSSANPSGLLFTGNDYFALGAFSISWNGTGYSSFAAWQTATGQEKIAGVNVGLDVDPMLVNPGYGGTVGGYVPPNPTAYDLVTGSPMIGAGLNLLTQFSINPGTQDFYGNSVPSGGPFSVGAYGGAGVSPPALSVTNTGGTVTTLGTNTVITFNGSGSLTSNKPFTASCLVVAGGGGGGNGGGNGGGGGAGGLLSGSATIASGTTAITVGSGGALTTDGTNSVLGTIATAIGGGGGGAGNSNGSSGGSSGGGGNGTTYQGAITAGQGNYGAGSGVNAGPEYAAGGGGGAGAAASGSAGGNGLASSITGTLTYYAGGGGGGQSTDPTTGGTGGGGASGQSGTSGTANTGGGGGGNGGLGGSGVVIISFTTIQ